MKSFEHFIEMIIFNSRWLLVPYYLGLVFAIALLLVKFTKEFIGFSMVIFTGTGTDVIIGVLTLIDVVLLSNLLLIIIFAGYENFVSKIDTGDSEDRPSWMGSVSFSDLKMKLIGSIVAISGIELLKAFVAVGDGSLTNEDLAWKVGIHLVFVVTGLLFAMSEWLTYNRKK